MIKIPSAYELIRTERIEEIGTDAYVLRHIKSGAHLILMDADDTNKVFDIGFRTPPMTPASPTFWNIPYSAVR